MAVEKFEVDIDALRKDIGKKLPLVVKRFAEDTYREVTKVTPRDTGRAKFSFTLSPNQPANRIPAEGEYGGRTAPIPNVNYDFYPLLYITSGLFYVLFLDQGSSQKAPEGIRAPVLRTRQAALNRIVARA